MLKSFFAPRLKIILCLLAVIYLLAIFGVSVGIYIPVLGTPFFLGGLLIWYIPGIVFAGTGLFKFHEFGAIPAGLPGHVAMFLFYFGIATLISLPFNGNWRKRRKLKNQKKDSM